MLRKKKVEPSQNDDFFSEGDDGAVDEHEPLPDIGIKKQTPKSRLLLLLLLLVAIAGAGYFYLLPSVEEPPPSPPAQAAVRKRIPVPPAPAPAQTAASASAAAPVTPAPASPATNVARQAVPPAPAAPASTKETPTPAKAATPAPSATVAKSAAQPAPAAKEAAAPVAAAKQAAPAAAKSVKEAAAPATAGTTEAVKAPAPAAGSYTIEAGAFLVKANRQAAEKAITRLGYKPKVTVVKRPVKMLRLRVGGPYSPMLAEAKLAEVAQFAPNAFSVPNGDQLVIYAGSFFLVDEARTLADQLYAEGIQVEEESAQVTMPLEIVTFGSFASKNAAADALAKAKKAGLQPIVIRK